MRNAKATTQQVATEPSGVMDFGLIAAAIGFLLPAILCAVDAMVSLVVGDSLPGGVLYVVLLVGVVLMVGGVFLSRLRPWCKIQLFCLLAPAYLIEILALAFFFIAMYGLDGVF